MKQEHDRKSQDAFFNGFRHPFNDHEGAHGPSATIKTSIAIRVWFWTSKNINAQKGLHFDTLENRCNPFTAALAQLALL